MESPIITLVVVQGKPPGKVLPFPPGSYYFGRGEECDLRTSSGMVSRQHCLLRVTTTESL
jgi:pSer/pThr/pTyr-binding forkhead associated (FHA) protein